MTTTTNAKADRYDNRAPRGGAISPVNGQWYRGGCWMPRVAEVVEVKPAKLEGSSRQILWAERIRREELTRLAEEVAVRRLMLADSKPIEAPAVRRAIRRDSIAMRHLMVERSAAAIIGLRVRA